MKCIYWNTKQISTLEEILDILEQEKPDLFFLSEMQENVITDDIKMLNDIDYEYYLNPGCSRVRIIKSIHLKVNLNIQSSYYTTLKIPNQNLYIISVHLPSQMFQSIDALKGFIRNFRNEIDVEIGSSINENILVIGDFNVNPFEKPMIDFDGFCASNSINFRPKITHLTIEKTLYYNPTWQLYSRNHFPGSKYFKRPSGTSYDILEHHYLDQVLLSQALSKIISTEKINVIEKTKKFVFFDNIKNLIKISDHLPLIYEFTLN